MLPQSAATRRSWEGELLRALLEHPTTYTTLPLRVERVVPYVERPVIRFTEDADANGLTDLISWGVFPTGGEHDLEGVKSRGCGSSTPSTAKSMSDGSARRPSPIEGYTSPHSPASRANQEPSGSGGSEVDVNAAADISR
ncbi:hypothetical protein GCM10010449_64560 [Streptomyces rectiviolaceus]|uniref:Uncharacterized protein n=1 Tax=Streptomyces rectiviolaceus TaxID=332591 RepID=A0ABP6N5V2_9ACTN